MRLSSGFHPRAWHVGAWILALLVLALALILSHRATGGVAAASAEPAPPPPTQLPGSRTEMPDPPPPVIDAVSDTIEAPAIPDRSRQRGMLSGKRTEELESRYVTEIVDSTYLVGPAEFFALDLPSDPPGSRAIHLLGTISTRGKAKDIIVRIFRSADYDRWLRKRGGEKAGPLWTSPRARSITIDQDLPQGQPLLLLLDNGFSLRTPKTVSCQLQIQYERTAEGFDTEGSHAGASGGSSTSPGDTVQDNLPTPRSNEEEDLPPPPPPPPEGN
jgi:hypothetical protein